MRNNISLRLDKGHYISSIYLPLTISFVTGQSTKLQHYLTQSRKTNVFICNVSPIKLFFFLFFLVSFLLFLFETRTIQATIRRYPWKFIEIFFHNLTYRLNNKTRCLSDGGAMTFPLLGAFRFPKRCLVYSWIFSRTRVLSSVLDVR